MIGDRLRELRASLGMSQREFAILAELSMSCLFQIEQGRHQPSADTIIKICVAGDVSADWLLELDDCEEEQP